MTPDQQSLVAAATAARERAYAPYSRFRVGAAVRAGGQIYAGCNVENASYGLSICAERAAVFAAVAAGQTHIEAVAVVTDTPEPTMPCGACRQVLREFGPRLEVIAATVGGATILTNLSDLLPASFGKESLGGTV
ncbi:MAG TPA: cytidine deaminase [Chloroflexota bacterium]|jgi:cytidine deaminase|nr:cytidine deaminase [Chloroflexota bacterium]